MATKKKAKKAKAAKAKGTAARKPAASKRVAKSAARKLPSKAAKPARKAAPKKAAAKKAAAKKAAPKRAAASRKPAKAAAPVRRRDRPGHIDPRYGADLLQKRTPEEAGPSGFIERPRSRDDLVEELGEEVVAEATSAEHEGEDILNQEVPEERGGPFVETSGDQEFARGTDASNPKGASREPFPRT